MPALTRISSAFARRFFRYLGPATVADLAWWLDTTKRAATAITSELINELVTVETALGPMLALQDIRHILDSPPPPPSVPLLPPDDPVINRRTARPWIDSDTARQLWPKAPPPGAVLIGGTVSATWRRRRNAITIHSSHPIEEQPRAAIVDSCMQLPLPFTDKPTVEFITF